MNDETVVGRVWNHPVNPGLRVGQMIQIPICDINILDDFLYGSISEALNVVEEFDPEVIPVVHRV